MREYKQAFAALLSRPSRARGLKHNKRTASGSGAESRPSRARGLKLALAAYATHGLAVAPITGAWVETLWRHFAVDCAESSRPSRARGLKLCMVLLRVASLRRVAPITGAWVET